ncbi:MAG: complex I subunit 1 family protein [Phycisphaerales bacterium]
MDKPSWFTAQLLVNIATIAIVVHLILVICAYLVYFERKISAYIQDRLGPNRVGFDFGLKALAPLKGMIGLGQSLADGIKFLLKEDYTPLRADKVLFTLAPIFIITPALMGFILIPWGGLVNVPSFTIPVLKWYVEGGPVHVAGANISVGIVYLLAVAALGVYGVTLGGYAGNNKYSFLGGLRASAQMISYEIPLGLSLMAALLVMGTTMPIEMIRYQEQHGWLILSQPLACLIFFLSILAEGNRAPFDNAEAEQELVGGYHTEYSSMRFALFFLAEYAHLVTSSAFWVLLFFGGYQLLPFVDDPMTSTAATGVLAMLIKFGVYMFKVVLVVCFMMVVRWTIPRLRYDQIMQSAWNVVIPLSLVHVVVISVMIHFGWTTTVPMLAANVGIVLLLLAVFPFIPKGSANRRIPMYGSRFNPMPGERVRTQSAEAIALEDRPIEGARPV